MAIITLLVGAVRHETNECTGLAIDLGFTYISGW